jgi:cysteine-rich CPXCG protein
MRTTSIFSSFRSPITASTKPARCWVAVSFRLGRLPGAWPNAASVVLPDRIAVSSSSVEHEFTCPYCGEEISMVLDLSVGRQTYIEDCEVCCKPIEISFTVEDDELAGFYAKTLG